MDFSAVEIKKMLDVALLSPIATPAAIEGLARVVRDEAFRFICVHSLHTRRAADVLQGSPAKVVACVGFPQGVIKTSLKAMEAEQAVADGAGEVDMVLALGALFAGDFAYAENDVRTVVRAAGAIPVKVIIETPYLSAQQKIEASKIVQAGGAAFVKTCTGCSPDPVALYEDIRLIRQTIGPNMGIKASGRVGNYFRFVNMIEAGATRVGLVLEQAREILKGATAR
jgi:deoxyribose-phosphate aldolase